MGRSKRKGVSVATALTAHCQKVRPGCQPPKNSETCKYIKVMLGILGRYIFKRLLGRPQPPNFGCWVPTAARTKGYSHSLSPLPIATLYPLARPSERATHTERSRRRPAPSNRCSSRIRFEVSIVRAATRAYCQPATYEPPCGGAVVPYGTGSTRPVAVQPAAGVRRDACAVAVTDCCQYRTADMTAGHR